MIFENREMAGQFLAKAALVAGYKNVLVFGIPRGGVVVAAEIAERLRAPLDVVVVRKLGVPFDPELAFGAIAPEGILALEHEFMERLGLTVSEMESVKAGEEQELERRLKLYRNGKPFPQVSNRIVLLVDDGVATGSTALAAIRFIKKLSPKKVVFCAPVCAPDTFDKIRQEAETLILDTPEDFAAVGQYYIDFPQIPDERVLSLLNI